jgi:hypothetical protein
MTSSYGLPLASLDPSERGAKTKIQGLETPDPLFFEGVAEGGGSS